MQGGGLAYSAVCGAHLLFVGAGIPGQLQVVGVQWLIQHLPGGIAAEHLHGKGAPGCTWLLPPCLGVCALGKGVHETGAAAPGPRPGIDAILVVVLSHLMQYLQGARTLIGACARNQLH
jgi:hypothetical protein